MRRQGIIRRPYFKRVGGDDGIVMNEGKLHPATREQELAD